MIRRRIALLGVLVFVLPGCADEVRPPAEVSVSLITPGVWNVNGTTDRILVWVHNEGASPLEARWNLTTINGSALPENWTFTATRTSAMLQGNGAKTVSGGRYTYPDWSWFVYTLTIPPNTPRGEHNLSLSVGEAGHHEFVLRTSGTYSRTSAAGDRVDMTYFGRFHHTGDRFDDGGFETTLGSGQTVPGFDLGLLGLTLHEPARLILPPAIAYGYDQTDASFTKFNAQTLRFDVEIQEFKS